MSLGGGTKAARQIIAVILTLLFSGVASSAVILTVDLSEENIITITATNEASSATVSGRDTTGFYLQNFFSNLSSGLGVTLLSGNLAGSLDISDGTPNLFKSTNADPFGLNVFSYVDGNISSFELGVTALVGSASWSVSSAAFQAALLGSSSGDIYFAADRPDDLPNASIIGQWSKITAVPEPSTLAILALWGSRDFPL